MIMTDTGSSARTSGIDLQNIDTAFRPQDDFYGYVNGKWLKRTQIPEDKSEISSFSRLDDTEQERCARWWRLRRAMQPLPMPRVARLVAL